MREFFDPQPIQLDRREYDYHTTPVTCSTEVKSHDKIMDEIVYNGKKIRSAGLSGSVTITVEGRDDYRKHVRGASPSEAVRKAIEEYEQHLLYVKDTADLLQAYRDGRVVN